MRLVISRRPSPDYKDSASSNPTEGLFYGAPMLKSHFTVTFQMQSAILDLTGTFWPINLNYIVS